MKWQGFLLRLLKFLEAKLEVKKEMKKRIDIIAGARPNFMKIAPIIKAIESDANDCLDYRLIHTGQHYDSKMSGDFFEQLGIPEPHLNLSVGSGTAAEQTAGIMIGYERVLLSERSDLCLVVGDVTSTMACAISAQKLHVPVAHVEAGIRSGDWTMPEEINRLVTDSITNHFFTTTKLAGDYLKSTGIAEEKIFFVGNTMIDTLLANLPKLRAPSFWDSLGLVEGQYFVTTLHRPSNVDLKEGFIHLLKTIGDATRGLPVIFPVHPRTAKQLTEHGDIIPQNIHLVDPQAYLEFNFLVKHSKAVITDSGGITEESTVMGIPCITLRDSTERPETVTIGTNEIIGTNPDRLHESLNKIFDNKWKKGGIPELWDGKTGERIVKCLTQILA